MLKKPFALTALLTISLLKLLPIITQNILHFTSRFIPASFCVELCSITNLETSIFAGVIICS